MLSRGKVSQIVLDLANRLRELAENLDDTHFVETYTEAADALTRAEAVIVALKPLIYGAKHDPEAWTEHMESRDWQALKNVLAGLPDPMSARQK